MYKRQVGGIPVPTSDLILGHPQAFMKYKGDSTINIYWSAGSSIQSVDLQFSDDGGVNWQQLASNVLATDESFTWTVPNIYSTRSFIKVIDHNDTTHQSRNLLSFSILPNGDTTQLPLYSRLSGFYQTPIDVSITAPPGSVISVSYTHLTLPTSDLV